MGRSGSEHKRNNGIYFTPDSLARSLVRPLITRQGLSILDPACGAGALLAAARDVCRKRWPGAGDQLVLYGCDRFHCESLASDLPDVAFSHQDFMQYRPDRQFDVVVTNPPFVRSQLIEQEAQERYRAQVDGECPLNGQADLWAYFVVKCSTHLKRSGCLGAILPWSFLQADYAADVRRWLAGRFRSIRLLLLTSDHFDGTTKRVLLAWFRGYGEPVHAIEMGWSASPEAECRYFAISRHQWERAPFACTATVRTVELFDRCKNDHGFTTLGELADIRIGVVSGADSFFILSKMEARDIGCRSANLVPILTSSRELRSLVIEGNCCRKFLLKLGEVHPKRYEEYIRQGESDGVDKRTHPARRDPWYSIDPGPAPDAFFHYRVSTTPFLVLNKGSLQSTNSIHRVYFRALSETEQRWVQISLLSVLGQLSLEAFGKTYGKGVLKVEPSALKDALCYRTKRRIRADDYERICKLVAQGDKESAVRAATDLLAGKAGIPDEILGDAQVALEELQGRRIPS